MPGLWVVPVSRQFHSREPPGKSFASLYDSASPSTPSFPQETWRIRGEGFLLSITEIDNRTVFWEQAQGRLNQSGCCSHGPVSRQQVGRATPCAPILWIPSGGQRTARPTNWTGHRPVATTFMKPH